MTERLYYADPKLSEFDATVTAIVELEGHPAVVLDRTAFYPTSGGQVFDTGWLESAGRRVRIIEVSEEETGLIYHHMAEAHEVSLEGKKVHGVIDVERRRDHMQQHSGQHILSAAFVKLFGMPTVSFHMGDETCTIDLDTKSLREEQIREAEHEANRIVMEDRPVEIRFASVETARAMGVRKIPDHIEGELRLIDMKGYDLNACGGTHVSSTGQIGPILLRKVEKVKQGFRVEFVCGGRAIATARRDFDTLTEAAGLYDTHILQVPELIRKAQDDSKAAAKDRKRLLEELAGLMAGKLLEDSPEMHDAERSFRLVKLVFSDRDTTFIKLLAQKITGAGTAVALLGAKYGQPGVVFAQTPGLSNDMGVLMKQALPSLGGRGGGNRDLAQGGAADASRIETVLEQIACQIQRSE